MQCPTCRTEVERSAVNSADSKRVTLPFSLLRGARLRCEGQRALRVVSAGTRVSCMCMLLCSIRTQTHATGQAGNPAVCAMWPHVLPTLHRRTLREILANFDICRINLVRKFVLQSLHHGASAPLHRAYTLPVTSACRRQATTPRKRRQRLRTKLDHDKRAT